MSHSVLLKSTCLNGIVRLVDRGHEYVVLVKYDSCDSDISPPRIKRITDDLPTAKQQFNRAVYQFNVDQGVEETDRFFEESENEDF